MKTTRGCVRFADAPGPVPGTGWGDGHRAGVAWAQATPPNADDGGFRACENVQTTGFPSEDYAAGFAVGVWAEWCADHPATGPARCLGTYACRRAVRKAAARDQCE